MMHCKMQYHFTFQHDTDNVINLRTFKFNDYFLDAICCNKSKN